MNWNRIISGLIALLYLGIAFAHGGMESAFRMGIALIFPLTCIWFADAMGGYRGLNGFTAITETSPGIIICILGWLLLLLPLIVGVGYVLFHAA
jgi:hypothetical protein